MELVKKLGGRDRIGKFGKIYRAYYGLFKCQRCGACVEREINGGKRTDVCQDCWASDRRNRQAISIVGKKIGRLLVLGRTDLDNTEYLCVCDCGKVVIVGGNSIQTMKTKSCGCLKRDRTAENHIKHGDVGTRIYKKWETMRGRCRNHRYYENVSVCRQWDNLECGYVNFKEWVVGQGYNDSSLDGIDIHRVDNATVYSPDTCILMEATEHREQHFIDRFASI